MNHSESKSEMRNEMQQHQEHQQNHQRLIMSSISPLSQLPQPPPPPTIQAFQINSPVVQMKIGNSSIPIMPHLVQTTSDSSNIGIQVQSPVQIQFDPKNSTDLSSTSSYNLIPAQGQQTSYHMVQQIKPHAPMVISPISQQPQQPQNQQSFVLAVTQNICGNIGTSASPISSNSTSSFSSSTSSNSSSPLIRANSINNGTSQSAIYQALPKFLHMLK